MEITFIRRREEDKLFNNIPFSVLLASFKFATAVHDARTGRQLIHWSVGDDNFASEPNLWILIQSYSRFSFFLCLEWHK